VAGITHLIPIPMKQLAVGFRCALNEAAGFDLPLKAMRTPKIQRRELIRKIFLWAVLCGSFTAMVRAQPGGIAFTQSAPTVETCDFVEVTIDVAKPDVTNPFTDASVDGQFWKSSGGEKTSVTGFCDSNDGSVFRIRFMPETSGDYSYSLSYHQGAYEKTHEGKFRAEKSNRRGMVRIDSAHRWHFVWEGTGEHYFFNGTTAYYIMGWKDEKIIESSIERLHKLEVNRMRVQLSGRVNTMFGEPVMNGGNFSVLLKPWPAQRPDSFERPGFDYTHFDLPYWQKFERMLRFARERDMINSVVLNCNDAQSDIGAGSENEKRYIRYALARLPAFSNITWDLGDDLSSFRSESWTHDTGMFIYQSDPYHHLATSHPAHIEPQDRGSEWVGFTSIQDWGRTQHQLMLSQRETQIKSGRIIPQTNEEYGYEDHYPLWAPRPPGDSADTLRRVAWDIAMAGAYGTGAESCRRGTNIWPDTGGGWLNGRGDDTMVLFVGYGHMVHFFSSFRWWETEPHDELIDNGAYCLAKPGEIYAAYLPNGGSVNLNVGPGNFNATWFNPRTGNKQPIDEIEGPKWASPPSPDKDDWALLILKAR
jgi:hypothetical protein